MNASAALIVKDLPPSGAWDFGGFPYGLEPLTLPAPADPEASLGADPWDACSPSDFEGACLRLLSAQPRDGMADGPDTVTQGDELFWFRWITGHQVSFIIWQLMARAIHKITLSGAESADIPEEICQYVRGYCGMLLYTSSCSRGVYETMIRPSMHLQHRAFSGSWAPDFQPVRDVFRGRRLQSLDTSDAAALNRSIRLYRNIHNGVATKLVRDGRSLLQQSQGECTQDRRLLGLIYDNYFMTLRAPVPFSDVVAQLLRRLNAIALDLATNGLHPVNSRDTESAEELHLHEVLELEVDLAQVNFRVASYAAGLTDSQVSPRSACASGRASAADLRG
jgi:hypothetical protein